MLNDDRKRALLMELRQDLEKYIQSQGLISNFIDSTCQDDDEIEYIQQCEWWVDVAGDE